MANFLIYPFKTMWISQNYNANGNPNNSHWWYSHGNPADYPLDERGADYGRDWFYCPCDEMEIVKIYGVGNTRQTNTIWMTSTSKVIFADLTTDYATIMCIHPNDDDLKKLKVGQKFKRFDKIFREGTDGHATGNHIHFEVGKGKMKGGGWAENNKGKWLLTTTDGAMKPEKAMAVDKSFTTIKEKQGLKFKSLRMVKQGLKYKVDCDTLNCREKPSTDAKIIKTLKKGKKFRVYLIEIHDGYKWGQCKSGCWVALKYCLKI